MQNSRKKKRARKYTLPSISDIDNVQRRFILNIIVNILEFRMKMVISYFLLRFQIIISVASSLSL